MSPTIRILVFFSVMIIKCSSFQKNLYRFSPQTSLKLSEEAKEVECITFVSSNQMKVAEVKLILGKEFPWELKCRYEIYFSFFAS
jgi:hypothetical protein